jgi:hypothetical protein
MTRWLVTLTGTEADLDRLVEWPDGDDWKIVRHEKHGVVLCGERFETLSDHDSVRRIAEALIEHLNRAARHHLKDFQSVTLGTTVERGRDGDHLALLGHDAVHVHETAKVIVTPHVHEDAVITGAPTQSDTPQPGVDCARLVALLEADHHLTVALDYIQDSDDWGNSYKAFEAIRDSVGSHAALLKTGWCSKRALDRFTQVVPEHDDWPEVEQRMIDAEGRAFVLDLLTKLIAYLDSTTP